MTQKELNFIEFVKHQCFEYGVKCRLKNVTYVKLSGNIKCSGYFDSEVPELVVAMNRKDWIEILVHEYCHLTQWVDNIPLWNKSAVSLEKIDVWLSGGEVRGINRHLGVARDLELDNEKRSVALIREWGLKVDVEHYIQKANAYVQFYNYMGISRRWSKPGNSPYSNENLINEMPDKFNMNYKKMSKKVEKVFKQENI
jgi:phosphorylcholine metabolism protein LicD